MAQERWHYVDSQTSRTSLRIGEGANIDPGVIIGQMSDRIMSLELLIGPGARIRKGTVIYRGSRIGSNLETGHYVTIREENHIGDGLRIWSNSVIDSGCRVGSNVKIHTKVYVGKYSIIEDDVFLSPGVTLASEIHPGCPDSERCLRGPCINKGAQVGVNCTILPRVIIGEYSVISPGSLVTRDIPPGVVACGNPAQVVCDIGEVKCINGRREGPYLHLVERI